MGGRAWVCDFFAGGGSVLWVDSLCFLGCG